MKRNEEEIKLVKDWLRFAQENLLLARAGMKEDYGPYKYDMFPVSGKCGEVLEGIFDMEWVGT